MDEQTSGPDPETNSGIREKLRTVLNVKKMRTIAHHHEAKGNDDRFVAMQNGRIEELSNL